MKRLWWHGFVILGIYWIAQGMESAAEKRQLFEGDECFHRDLEYPVR